MHATKIRTCIACGASMSKQDLVRFVRTASGEIFLDATGRQKGRGAYICGKHGCFETAFKRKAFQRALRTSIDDATFERLRDEFASFSPNAPKQ